MRHRNAVLTSPRMGRIWEEKWLLGLAVFVLAVFYALWRSSGGPGTSAPNSTQVPPFYESAEAAKPFPVTLSPALFKDKPDVAPAYSVAQTNPGLLAQQPCYCWCNKRGHRSLLDCFASRHAETCSICIREALLAGHMSRAGKTAGEVRAAIIRGDWNRTG